MHIEGPGLFCIIGPNGVGKSTLVKCLNQLLMPDEGRIRLNHRDLEDMHLGEISRKIGFVPVATNDTFSTGVLDTVLMGRFPHRHHSSKEKDITIALESLKALDIEELALRNVNEISAGQRQRVAIAKGIAQEPEVLILDEPTANLDARHQIIVTKLMHKISAEKGMTVIMISHDLNIASKYADSVIVMAPPGKVIVTGPPNEVITKELIRDVYGVDCEIVDDHGRPHVILEDAI